MANAVGVSRSLVPADGFATRWRLRELVKENRAGRPSRSALASCRPARKASKPSLPSLARRSVLFAPSWSPSKKRLRLQLGAEIEGLEKAQLITRVAELEASNRQLVAERDARALEADSARRRIAELAAARESLRQVIRQQNRTR